MRLSIVPDFISSAQIFIDSAEAKKIKIRGSDSNKILKSAIFLEKKVSIQKNLKRTTNKKTPINISAKGEAKKELISFLNTAEHGFSEVIMN
tara:strand:+ start:29 stop:304 length:276 start_codon:yes stop_codon:yes gene_type:complete